VVGETVTEIGCSVTVAVPTAVESKTLVAVTVTFWLAAIGEGAVYKPLLASIVPTCGEMLHVTPVWLIPVTLAENRCDCPFASVTEGGLTRTVIITGANVINTEADCVGSATLVAVAVTICRVVMKFGAL
jgi:hypothetical protein